MIINTDMKFYIAILFSFILSFDLLGQSVSQPSEHIQNVIDACVSLRDAVACNDSLVVRKSSEKLKDEDSFYFTLLQPIDSIDISFNGHLIFHEMFAEKYLSGEDAFAQSDEVNQDILSDIERGQNADGLIKTRTCFVKAGQSVKYEFGSKGHQELAVVAETGGLLTMKVRVTNRDGMDKRYDDTADVRNGRSYRYVSFDLPLNRRNIVELEIINCGLKDCSFVVISN